MADEAKRVRDIAAGIYANGYADGMSQAAEAFGLERFIPRAGDNLADGLKVRLDLIDDAVSSYLKMVERKAAELAASGMEGDVLWVNLEHYAAQLADTKSEIISEMEFAQARLDGAGDIMDEAGETYEWRFAHFDLGGDHEECPICEAIREGSPYSQDDAEAEGFPEYPHPGCDHGWVLVPKGELTQTEKL